MPQLDFSMYASQGLWIIVSFCLLWGLLAIFVTPKIADIQEQRKRKIHGYVYKAEQLKNEAENKFEKYEKALVAAKDKAKEKIEYQQHQVQKYIEESETQMTDQLNQQIALSEFQLAKEKKETMQQIDNISATIALDIVKKLGFDNISARDIKTVAKKEKI